MVACRMLNSNELHQPVLLNEVVTHLVINPDGLYVDATFGRGGHTQSILDRLSQKGRLIAFDKDLEAVAYAKLHFSNDPRFFIFHASFSSLKDLLNTTDFQAVDGILFDLGMSSPQLDTPDRGFSFMREGKLDMRMDTSQGETAAEWLARVSEQELANVLWVLGEERFSRQIARQVVETRVKTPLQTTAQLADLISKTIPFREKGKHPATRSFQAIRIFINHELDDLQSALDQAYELLAVGGRLVVISFHSLEDRIVKQFMSHKERAIDDLPSRLPIKHQASPIQLKRIGRALKPSEQEIAANPRARSAILRIAEKRQ